MAVGLRPCSGAILVLVFALAQGMFWAGIAATFAMGLGTAITVALIAVLAVSAKDLARRLSAGREGSGALIMRVTDKPLGDAMAEQAGKLEFVHGSQFTTEVGEGMMNTPSVG